MNEAEDVVDEEEHVLALVAEVLRHGQPREADAQPGSRGLVHLAEDERHLAEHARLLHLPPEVVPLAGPLPDAAEDRHAAVLLGDVVDELLDEHRLAEPRASEEADLASLHEGRDEVDDLEAGLEDLDLRREVAERRWFAMDRPALDALRRVALLVDRIADDVPQATERRLADGDGDRPRGVDAHGAAGETVRRVHRHGTDAIVAEVLLHLRDQRPRAAVGVGDLDLESRVDLRQQFCEDDVDHDALDLDDRADVPAVVLFSVRHSTPRVRFEKEKPGTGPGRALGV